MPAPTSYRGIDGFVALGGVLKGAPLINGAVAQNASAANLDAASLSGVVQAGDTFTVAGDATVYTVLTGGVVAANSVAITFTPACAKVGGWPDNAAVSCASNSIAQARKWSASVQCPELDTTVLGAVAEGVTLGLPKWTGSVEALFDYGDAKQAAFIAQAKVGAAAVALTAALGIITGKILWGSFVASQLQITSDSGSLVAITMALAGDGAPPAPRDASPHPGRGRVAAGAEDGGAGPADRRCRP